MTMVIEGPTEGQIKLQDDESIHSGKLDKRNITFFLPKRKSPHC
jgi:hypothetical protein